MLAGPSYDRSTSSRPHRRRSSVDRADARHRIRCCDSTICVSATGQNNAIPLRPTPIPLSRLHSAVLLSFVIMGCCSSKGRAVGTPSARRQHDLVEIVSSRQLTKYSDVGVLAPYAHRAVAGFAGLTRSPTGANGSAGIPSTLSWIRRSVLSLGSRYHRAGITVSLGLLCFSALVSRCTGGQLTRCHVCGRCRFH
jgi:hypothetical protein